MFFSASKPEEGLVNVLLKREGHFYSFILNVVLLGFIVLNSKTMKPSKFL